MGLADSTEYSLGGQFLKVPQDPQLRVAHSPSEVCLQRFALQVWSPHQQHQHCLETCYECRIPDPSLGVRNSWAWDPTILGNAPGNFDAKVGPRIIREFVDSTETLKTTGTSLSAGSSGGVKKAAGGAPQETAQGSLL